MLCGKDHAGPSRHDAKATHVMPLNEINNAFELMKRGESIRGVVTF
jgi:S-(hydroxymethyl)glutathione dehydrogenase/alcohol dehydrogenase